MSGGGSKKANDFVAKGKDNESETVGEVKVSQTRKETEEKPDERRRQ